MQIIIAIASYVVICAVVVGAGVWVARRQPNKTLGTLIKTSAFVIALPCPIWFLFFHSTIFEVVCKLSPAGTQVYDAFKVDAFTTEREEYMELPLQYGGGHWDYVWMFPACDQVCGERLQTSYSVFSFAHPWFSFADAGTSVEQSWLARKGRLTDTMDTKYTRMWVAPIGSPECIAPLHEGNENRRGTRCIAGREIERITTSFTLDPEPFTKKTNYGGDLKDQRTSLRWRLLGIERHEHHLRRQDKLVARYVWFERNLIPNNMFTHIEICPPFKPVSWSNQGLKDFWSQVLSPSGVSK